MNLKKLVELDDAEKDWDVICAKAEALNPQVKEFMSTWASNCGAPRSVFLGHFTKLMIDIGRDI